MRRFVMDLCIAFAEPSPRRLLGRMSSADLTDWLVYAGARPIGGQLDDWRAGMLAATVVKVATGKAMAPSDFYPPRPSVRPKNLAEKVTLIMRSLMAEQRDDARRGGGRDG
jgi:hypothetical protein